MTATVIPFRRRHDAGAVQVLARAVRHRQVAAALANGAMQAVVTLAQHAVHTGGLDYSSALGLQLAVLGARDAAAELTIAHHAVEAAAGEVDHA